MRFYRHYKNKPYRYLGVVRHSESLDEHVLYECLYENDLGKLWVRPKTMFHESVDLGQGPVPRFKLIPLEIQVFDDVSAAPLNALHDLASACFKSWDPTSFRRTLEAHPRHRILLASVDGQLVGYKIGYEHDPETFYSWVGGVHPAWRGLGVASDLMKRQHDDCRASGYLKVRTKTQNRYREMLLLNLKSGFDVVGTQTAAGGELKILLEKTL